VIYLELFLAFFKIGLFSFGGGYAMISLISEEVVKHQWLLESEFIQIIGIAEMTPGPIAVNSATYLGYRAAGILGATFATIGVAMPSLIIILFLSPILFKNVDHPLVRQIFYCIRPIIAGLIVSAAINVSKSTLFIKNISDGDFSFNYYTLIIAIIILGIQLWKKPHPILLIVLSAILGAGTLFFPLIK